jgi:drug/metabolite transporter (DMT)-like permease
MPYIKMTCAMLILGSYVVVGKLITSEFPVFLASELRLLLAVLFLYLLILIQKKGFPRLSKRDHLIVFTQSFFGTFIFNVCFLYGLRYTGGIESGIVFSTTAAWIGLISFFILKEKIGKSQLMGIICAVLGVLALNVLGSLEELSHSFHLLGNLLILCTVIGEAIFVSFGKLTSKQVSPLSITFMVNLYGCLLFLPFALYELPSFSFAEVTFADWMLIVYAGIVVAVLAFILMTQAVKEAPANRIAPFTAIVPLSAVFFSYFILEEPIVWYHYIGLLFVLLGIYFSTKRDSTSIST